MWGRTGREHGEVPRFVLPGREPACGRPGLSTAAKSSGDEWLCHDVAFLCVQDGGSAIRAPADRDQNPAKPCGLL